MKRRRKDKRDASAALNLADSTPTVQVLPTHGRIDDDQVPLGYCPRRSMVRFMFPRLTWVDDDFVAAIRQPWQSPFADRTNVNFEPANNVTVHGNVDEDR